MTSSCPICQNFAVEPRNTAKKAGSALGALVGGVAGTVGALRGAQLGALSGRTGGPVGITIGAVCGAVIGGLATATTGSSAGAMLGEAVDNTCLKNLRCMSCGHTFSTPRHSTPMDDSFTDTAYPYA